MALLASILTIPGNADSGEVVYLCHCGDVGGGTGGAVYSTIVYYKDASKSHAGQQPDAIPKGGHLQGGPSHWEGSTTSATFLDGNVFTGTIKAGAGNVPTGFEVGSGANKYRQFTCYKDSGRALYLDDRGTTCYANYFCT